MHTHTHTHERTHVKPKQQPLHAQHLDDARRVNAEVGLLRTLGPNETLREEGNEQAGAASPAHCSDSRLLLGLCSDEMRSDQQMRPSPAVFLPRAPDTCG